MADTLDPHRRAGDSQGQGDGGSRGARNGDSDHRRSGTARRRRGTASGLSSASLTVAGSVMGTPGYMPPEQASAKEVDERADVYALGAIFYHLLGGAEPYKGTSADAILAAVLVGPPAPLARVEPGLPPDLVTIVEKAMAREPDARYPTAVQLAEDLRRFQTGKLVGAHHYSRRELVLRFLVRHRAAAVVTAAALVVVAAMALVSFRRVVAERDRAELAGAAAARRADELAVAQAGSLLDEDPRAALGLLARLSPAATTETWRTARMVASDARLRGVPQTLRGFEGPLNAFDMSPDGQHLVSAHVRDVWAWDLPRGRGRRVGHQDVLIQDVAVSPDGRHAVTAGLDSRLRLWSLDDRHDDRAGRARRDGHRHALPARRRAPDHLRRRRRHPVVAAGRRRAHAHRLAPGPRARHRRQPGRRHDGVGGRGRRCASGVSASPRRCASCTRSRARSAGWRCRRTVRAWPLSARRTRCGCGRWRPERADRCPATTRRS